MSKDHDFTLFLILGLWAFWLTFHLFRAAGLLIVLPFHIAARRRAAARADALAETVSEEAGR